MYISLALLVFKMACMAFPILELAKKLIMISIRA